MNMDIESIRIRIARLKRLIEQRQATPNLPETIQHILRTAPQAILDLEAAINNAIHPEAIAQIHAVLSQMESYVEWAAGEAGGRKMAENLRAGRPPDPNQPPDRRLMERITAFMVDKIDRQVYASLIREWAGDDAVDGNTMHLDPREVDALSQWMIFDKVLPGQSQRIVELYAQEAMEQLPSAERDLLTNELGDRPSVYQVVKIPRDRKTKRKKMTYIVKDLLADEAIRIRDRATSLSLHQGAIFVGRAIPFNPKEATYTLLGSVTEIPKRLWSELSVFLEQLQKDCSEQLPGLNNQDFFRAHHARLRRRIQETAG